MKEIFFIIYILCQSFKVYPQIKTADSLWKKGFEIFQKNQLDSLKSLELLRKSQKIYLQNKALTSYAGVFLYTGEVYFEAANFKKALNEFYIGANTLEKKHISSSDSTLFKLYESIGFMLQKDLQYDQSKIYFDKAEKLLINNREKFQTKPILPYVYAFYSNYGVTFNILGDYKSASLYFEKASEIGRFPEVSFLLNFGLRDEAQLAMEMGDYAKSSKLLKEAIKATRFEMDKCNQFSELGKSYFLSKDYRNAQLYLDKAYKLLIIIKNKKIEFVRSDLEKSLLNTLGDLNFETEKYDNAQKYYQKSLAISTLNYPNGKDIYASKAFLGLGKISLKQHFTVQSLTFFQKSIASIHKDFNNNDIYKNPSLNGILSPKEMFNVLQSKAATFHHLYQENHELKNLKMSFSTYQLAIKLSENIRRSYESADAKLFFTNKVFPAYSQAMEAGYELYKQTKQSDYKEFLFEINEKSKVATLSDALRDIKIKPEHIDANLLNQERILHQNINSIRNKILKETNSTNLQNLQKSLVDNELALLRLVKSYETQSPNYYQLKYNFSTISIPQIQAKLEPQTAFISYFVGERNYAFLITKTSSQFVQLMDNLSLENDTKALFSELYRKPGLGLYKGSSNAQRLYNTLLKPFEKELSDKTRLIILRDGNLNFLPFEILEKSTNDFLVKHFAISYGYSATILFNSLNDKTLQSKNNLMAIAPYTSKQHLPSTFRDKTLQPLPASGEEVFQIGGDIYTDQQATKNRFLSTYQQHGIIHFATHAQVDDREAGRSFIAFYPDSSGYKLYTEELYNLSLEKTRLVVLSACETGRGQLHQGEGILSLARAFAYAGCPSVVATLWNAHDESTAFLSERLHHYLQENKPIDMALQQAKLDYFKSKIGKELDHPYYWANFILLGNAEAVNEDVGWGWWVWAGISGVALMVIFAFTSRKFFSLSGSSVNSTSRK